MRLCVLVSEYVCMWEREGGRVFESQFVFVCDILRERGGCLTLCVCDRERGEGVWECMCLWVCEYVRTRGRERERERESIEVESGQRVSAINVHYILFIVKNKK